VRAIPGVRCYYFDSIGVPTAEVIKREFGGGEKWQAAATTKWLKRLSGLSEDMRIAVLEGQTRPSFVFRAARLARVTAHVVLLDCLSDVRAARLRGSRQQPELANVRMNRWATFLRGQAHALDLPIIDTSLLTVTEAAEQLEAIVRGLIESDAPAA
jgi:hypothetical protein